MKLLTFIEAGGPGRPGCLRGPDEDAHAVDLSSPRMRALLADAGLPAISSTADVVFAAAEDDAYLATLASLVDAADDGWLPRIAIESIVFQPPLRAPGKIIGVGSNYPTHKTEAKGTASATPAGEAFDWPTSFAKFPSTMVGHGATLAYPGDGMQFDYEGELCVVIGRTCRAVRAQNALDYVFGYVIGNDLSARSLQFKEMKRSTLSMGKNLDTFCPIGPYLVTKDEIADPQALRIETRVNGELRQSDSTGSMLFPVARLIEHFSTATLQPGDVIMTGTPAGVGIFASDPERALLKPGDHVSVRIDGLGRLENTVG